MAQCRIVLAGPCLLVPLCAMCIVHPSGSCGGRRCPTATASMSNSQQHSPFLSHYNPILPITVLHNMHQRRVIFCIQVAAVEADDAPQPLHPCLTVNNTIHSFPLLTIP